MPDELFAWQGFSLPISENWRPTVLTGNFKRGYVRLDGERDDLLQIRWESCKRPLSLNKRALNYLAALESACRKRKSKFSSEVVAVDEGSADFEWHSEQKGYGRVWYDGDTRRVFLVERSGPRGGSFKRDARQLADDFVCWPTGLRPWSVFGLSVFLPSEYELTSCKFLTGRITLALATKGAKLSVERWGLAESLLAKTSLEDWAKALVSMNGCRRVADARLELSGRRGTALVYHDCEKNQLIVINSQHKRGREPSWEWICEAIH